MTKLKYIKIETKLSGLLLTEKEYDNGLQRYNDVMYDKLKKARIIKETEISKYPR